MHFSCIIMGIFGTFIILGFLMIRTYFCEIDQWVFVLWCYNDVPYSLIWSILWFFEKLKILGFWMWSELGILSNWLKLIKLASQIDVFGHYICYSIMCNDQFVNIFQIDQVVFQIWFFFVLKLLMFKRSEERRVGKEC